MKEKEKVEKWGKYDELLRNEGKLWFAVSFKNEVLNKYSVIHKPCH